MDFSCLAFATFTSATYTLSKEVTKFSYVVSVAVFVVEVSLVPAICFDASIVCSAEENEFFAKK